MYVSVKTRNCGKNLLLMYKHVANLSLVSCVKSYVVCVVVRSVCSRTSCVKSCLAKRVGFSLRNTKQ